MDAGEPLLLAYTSGTTGRPKGAVHTHAGFLVKTASEVAYSFDVKPGGVFSWVTDMGWIMGPLSVFGTHANGATLLLYEGSPDRPDTNRLWRLVERHGVTMLGVSPTLVRALRSAVAIRRRTCHRCTCWVRLVNPGTPSPTSGWPATCSADAFR